MNIVVRCETPAECGAVARKLGVNGFDDEPRMDVYVTNDKWGGYTRERGWFAKNPINYPFDKTITAEEFLAQSSGRWTRASDAMPDPGRRILISMRDVMHVTSYNSIDYPTVKKDYPYWMYLPELPEKPIQVGEHTVVFNNDGSIQVGCTRVSSDTLDEIFRRRESKRN